MPFESGVIPPLIQLFVAPCTQTTVLFQLRLEPVPVMVGVCDVVLSVLWLIVPDAAFAVDAPVASTETEALQPAVAPLEPVTVRYTCAVVGLVSDAVEIL